MNHSTKSEYTEEINSALKKPIRIDLKSIKKLIRWYRKKCNVNPCYLAISKKTVVSREALAYAKTKGLKIIKDKWCSQEAEYVKEEK